MRALMIVLTVVAALALLAIFARPAVAYDVVGYGGLYAPAPGTQMYGRGSLGFYNMMPNFRPMMPNFRAMTPGFRSMTPSFQPMVPSFRQPYPGFQSYYRGYQQGYTGGFQWGAGDGFQAIGPGFGYTPGYGQYGYGGAPRASRQSWGDYGHSFGAPSVGGWSRASGGYEVLRKRDRSDRGD